MKGIWVGGLTDSEIGFSFGISFLPTPHLSSIKN